MRWTWRHWVVIFIACAMIGLSGSFAVYTARGGTFADIWEQKKATADKIMPGSRDAIEKVENR